MVPTPINLSARSTPRLVYGLASLILNNAPRVARSVLGGQDSPHVFAKRAEEIHGAKVVVYAILIPVLVLLSGLFAGLTLGYMSLDETQLHVLSISGTPKQKAYAKKIEPIRKNGHLLLVTLLLANMIVNETLPVIVEPLLGGFEGVVISTVLIVIFAEIIPQSLCTRHGLAIGANMAWLVWILIYTVGIISWPVAKLLEFILGPHHGIMYRRGELKELIAMHAATGQLGGDLNTDTVTIIGATLDLQEKVVKQAMTPIDSVFMLDINCKLDYEMMKLVGDSGHSRVPVYEEIEVPVMSEPSSQDNGADLPIKHQKVKKIIGILLVKQLLMLDPKDATPLRKIPLNRANFVPNNTSLLSILDRFQEGRSHMAIVSRYSEEKALSIKQQVKKGLTQRLMERVGIADSESDTSESDSDGETVEDGNSTHGSTEGSGSEKGKSKKKSWKRFKHKRKRSEPDVEKGDVRDKEQMAAESNASQETVKKDKGLTIPHGLWAKLTSPGREQNLPDDAVLEKQDVKEFLVSFDPAVHPLGIITLEDVLEELIGEEIYDEFDPEGESQLKTYVSPSKRGRAHDPPANISAATAIPEGITASGDSHQQASPINTDETQVYRNPSLAPSLTALAAQRRNRGTSTPPVITTAVRQIMRGRSKQRAGSMPDTNKEAGPSIPNDQERTGPDIGNKYEEQRNEQE